MSGSVAHEWVVFRLATQLLTRLPVGEPEWSPEAMQATPRWYPGVGILVGVLSALALWVALAVFPPVIAVLIAMAVGIGVTGAMHEDGLADCCDAFGGHALTERALEIMRDSRLGTYALLGLGMTLALKVATLAQFAHFSTGLAAAALIGGHAISRLAVVAVMSTLVYVREEGAGKPVAGGEGNLGLATVLGIFGVVPMAVIAGLWPTIVALIGGGLGLWAIRRMSQRRVGGYTGDCLGAAQQVSELGFLLGALAAL